MAEDVTQRLVLAAYEIKELTGWPDAMVEDYLNILQDLATVLEDIEDNTDQINDNTANIAINAADIDKLEQVQAVLQSFINRQAAINANNRVLHKKLEQLAYI